MNDIFVLTRNVRAILWPDDGPPELETICEIKCKHCNRSIFLIASLDIQILVACPYPHCPSNKPGEPDKKSIDQLAKHIKFDRENTDRLSERTEGIRKVLLNTLRVLNSYLSGNTSTNEAEERVTHLVEELRGI